MLLINNLQLIIAIIRVRNEVLAEVVEVEMLRRVRIEIHSVNRTDRICQEILLGVA